MPNVVLVTTMWGKVDKEEGKQREEEIANQVASPGSTTSALEPADVGAPTLVESPSLRVNGIEMEGVGGRGVVGENGEADAMVVDTPAEEEPSSFTNGTVDGGGESKELTRPRLGLNRTHPRPKRLRKNKRVVADIQFVALVHRSILCQVRALGAGAADVDGGDDKMQVDGTDEPELEERHRALFEQERLLLRRLWSH